MFRIGCSYHIKSRVARRGELLALGFAGCTLFASGVVRAQAAPPANATPPAPMPAPSQPSATAPASEPSAERMMRVERRLAELEARVAADDKKAEDERRAAEDRKAALERKAAEEKRVEAEKPAEPFAFADFSWLNGANRQKEALLDSKYFTGSFLLDVNYTVSAANPIDHTVVGSTTLLRNNEMTLQFMGFGGDFHWADARARLMMQYGTRAVVVPRNDGSTFKGQFDLATALRYVSEVNGGTTLM